MRVFSGAILGFLLFEFLWRGIFYVTNTDPHAPASILFEFGAVIAGLLFAGLAGHLASFVGGRPHFIAAWIAAGLVVLIALVTMVRKIVAWPQIVELFLLAPAVVVGGWSYVLRQRAQARSQDDGN